MAVRKPGARKPSETAAKSAPKPARVRAAASMAALGTTNMSETVNVALDRLAEDAAIRQGLEAATGEIPDFPYLDS